MPDPSTDARTTEVGQRTPEENFGASPRWVKVFLITGGVLVLLFVLATITGIAGEHGPGRHGSGNTPSSVPDGEGGGGHGSMDHDQ